MNQDFVTRLQLQLRDAAERESRRGRLGRAAAAARWHVNSQPAIAGAALAGAALACVLALAIVLAATRSGDHAVTRPVEPAVPAGKGLDLVADTELMGRGGPIAVGFGSVWAGDPGTGEVLRIDPRSRRVVARVPVGGGSYVNVGAGSVWASAGPNLLRIDPATNRVTARIPLRLGRFAAAVFPGRGVMWVPTSLDLLRVDPVRNAIDRRIPLEHGSFQARGFAVDGRLAYVLRGDGVLLTFDAATGERVASTRSGVSGFLGAAGDGSALIASGPGVVAVDPRSGRRRWRAPLGAERINDGIVAGGALWVHATDAATHRDMLVRLDLRDGRQTGRLALPHFGAGGMSAVGGDVWVVSGAGRLMVVR